MNLVSFVTPDLVCGVLVGGFAGVLGGRALMRRRVPLAPVVDDADAILDAQPGAVLTIGAEGRLRQANRAARAMLGGEMPALLRHPDLRDGLAASVPGVIRTVEIMFTVPVRRELGVGILRLGDAQESVFALFVEDHSWARAVERQRADFVANVSHELRTPLSNLMGFIDTLRGPAADDPQARARFLPIMAEQAARMGRLIGDLLGLSRIELVEHQSPTALCDLTQLARDALREFETRLADARIDLVMDVPPAGADFAQVQADSDQLMQVMQNLIENAIRYGGVASGASPDAPPDAPTGEITVRVARAQGQRWPAGPGVVLSVADRGQGIERAHIPRLTERFYRVDGARSRATGGTGLGLAIVKHIVNRHRGVLAIDSAPGQGSCFSIWLPISARAAV